MRHEALYQWIDGKLVKTPCPCGRCEMRRLKVALAILFGCCAAGAGLVVAACRVL